MFKIRYYCQAQGNEEIAKFLTKIEAEHRIPYKMFALSRGEIYDEEKERRVYERDFKPRAKILKKRTGESVRKELRGGKGKKRYYVSKPGTIAVIRNEKIEWYAVGDDKIITFLGKVLSKGVAFLEKCCGDCKR